MKKEIFIIDDDPIYRLIVSKTIKNIDSSLPITECENGEIGLAKLESTKNMDDEIIVLLDINMPVSDGWDVLDELEKNNFHQLSLLSIYLVSSSTDKSDLIKSNAYKFIKGFISKPFKREDIKSVIGLQ
mgnify:CR=1 FL=1